MKSVYDAAAFPAAIVESSDHAIITTWNKAAETVFGYTASEAIGRPLTLIIPDDRLEEEPTIHAGYRVQHFETERRRNGEIIRASVHRGQMPKF